MIYFKYLQWKLDVALKAKIESAWHNEGQVHWKVFLPQNSMKSLSPLCRGVLSNAAMEEGKRDVRIILQLDGVYNWPQHRLKYGRGSEKPAAHTQQKNYPCTPSRGVSITYSSTIIYVLVMVLLSIFFLTPYFTDSNFTSIYLFYTLSTSWPQAPFDSVHCIWSCNMEHSGRSVCELRLPTCL